MTMRYFLRADPGDDVESGRAALLRLEAGLPLALGEVLLPDGTWRAADFLAQYHLFGKDDIDINEIPTGRAREIALARHASGRYAALPDPMPGDPAADDPPRSQEERAERAAHAERAAVEQAVMLRRWAQVAVPPGAAGVSLRGDR